MYDRAMNVPSSALLALALAGAAACTGSVPAQNAGMPPAAAEAVIEGTAAYRERIALPPNAELEAVLQDVSRADAHATEIARTTVPNAPSPPIRFTIPYDPAKIDPAHSYAVRAAIRVDGKLWFTTDTAHPVLTRGAGRAVDILLKRVAQPAAADAELLNTYWKILALAGDPVSVAPGQREPHVILRSSDGRESWSATVGCNSMSGGLAVAGDRIAFKPGIATLMACPPPLDALEKTLSQSLTASTQWRIEGARLELRNDAGEQTLLFEAVHLE